jgi:hypothetical protein
MCRSEYLSMPQLLQLHLKMAMQISYQVHQSQTAQALALAQDKKPTAAEH